MKIEKGSIEDFRNRIKGKRNVYCFGAGNVLDSFLTKFEKYNLEDDIKFIVDNSEKKQGTIRKCTNRVIPIISRQQMAESISSDDIILITTLHFLEIIEQLGVYDNLTNISCYVYIFLIIGQVDYEKDKIIVPKDLSTEADICIPKVIHYCWFGGEKIPNQNRLWMESWKKYCPDYQIIEWNENNYDVFKNQYMKQAYERRKWAFVSDYARVDIIAQYGGVYLDTDVELVKNIDVMLKNQAFCGFESKDYVAFGLGFGAVKKHRIIEELRDDYDERVFVLEEGGLNMTACPIYQTETLMKYGMKRNGEFQKIEGITIYPERVLCGINSISGRVTNKFEDVYGIHHFSGSWVEGNDMQKQRLREEAIEYYNNL